MQTMKMLASNAPSIRTALELTPTVVTAAHLAEILNSKWVKALPTHVVCKDILILNEFFIAYYNFYILLKCHT